MPSEVFMPAKVLQFPTDKLPLIDPLVSGKLFDLQYYVGKKHFMVPTVRILVLRGIFRRRQSDDLIQDLFRSTPDEWRGNPEFYVALAIEIDSRFKKEEVQPSNNSA